MKIGPVAQTVKTSAQYGISPSLQLSYVNDGKLSIFRVPLRPENETCLSRLESAERSP